MVVKCARGTACRQDRVRNSGGHAEPILREFPGRGHVLLQVRASQAESSKNDLGIVIL